MVLRGNEEGAKEKFNSRMPYLYLGAEQVCLFELILSAKFGKFKNLHTYTYTRSLSYLCSAS